MAEQLCIIAGCNNHSRTKGLCQQHVMTLRRGAPLQTRSGTVITLVDYAQGKHLEGEEAEYREDQGIPQGEGTPDEEGQGQGRGKGDDSEDQGEERGEKGGEEDEDDQQGQEEQREPGTPPKHTPPQDTPQTVVPQFVVENQVLCMPN